MTIDGMNSELRSRVQRALDGVFGVAKPRGLGWDIGAVATGINGGITVTLDQEGWLRMVASVEPPAVGAWTLLRWNSYLEAGAKFTIEPEEGSVELIAEIPVAVCGSAEAWLGAAAAGLARGQRLQRGEEIDPTRGESSAGDAAGGADDSRPAGLDLALLCREAGWDCEKRDPHRVRVELDLDAGSYQVELRDDRCGAVLASVALVEDSCGGPGGSCRQALAQFLLRSAACIYVVRPTVCASGEGWRASYELRFPCTPTSAEIGEALSALWVAASLGGVEAVRLSTDEGLARDYLTMAGQSGRSADLLGEDESDDDVDEATISQHEAVGLP